MSAESLREKFEVWRCTACGAVNYMDGLGRFLVARGAYCGHSWGQWRIIGPVPDGVMLVWEETEEIS